MNEDKRAKYLHGQPRTITVEQQFRLVLRLLRENFPTTYPVKVRRVPRDEPSLVKLHANGYTHLVNAHKKQDQRYFLIAMNREMDWAKMLDAMMHEWAHALTWEVPSSQDHPRDWAHAYGKIYRFLIED